MREGGSSRSDLEAFWKRYGYCRSKLWAGVALEASREREHCEFYLLDRMEKNVGDLFSLGDNSG